MTKRTSIAPTTASSWASSVEYLKSHVGGMALGLALSYVDLAADGTVQDPASLVDDEEVDVLLALLEEELRFCEVQLAGVSAERWAESLVAMRDSSQAVELRGLLASHGASGAIGYALAVRNGFSHEEAVSMAVAAAEVFAADHEDDPKKPGEDPSRA